MNKLCTNAIFGFFLIAVYTDQLLLSGVPNASVLNLKEDESEISFPFFEVEVFWPVKLFRSLNMHTYVMYVYFESLNTEGYSLFDLYFINKECRKMPERMIINERDRK